jgi:hypothetical protein
MGYRLAKAQVRLLVTAEEPDRHESVFFSLFSLFAQGGLPRRLEAEQYG